MSTPTFGLKKASREALIRQVSNQLIRYKRIKTTKEKAKSVAKCVAYLITKVRKYQEINPLHAKRQVFNFLRDKETTQMLLKEVLLKVGDRAGGYTRIITLGKRFGDGATLVMLELVDYNLIYKKKQVKAKATRRSTKKGNTKKAVSVADTSTTDQKDAKDQIKSEKSTASPLVEETKKISKK